MRLLLRTGSRSNKTSESIFRFLMSSGHFKILYSIMLDVYKPYAAQILPFDSVPHLLSHRPILSRKIPVLLRNLCTDLKDS